jgi:hypothetical protein
MEENEIERFESLWMQSQNQEPVKKIEIKQSRADLSLSNILERFLLLAEMGLRDNRISKADYEELAQRVAEMKTVLARINEQDLISNDIATRSRRRKAFNER